MTQDNSMNDAVKKSFSKAASTYDEFALFQKEVAFEVFGKLSHMLGQRVLATSKSALAETGAQATSFLDIGSGTGSLAGLAASKMPNAKAVASDISVSMLRKAGEKHASLLLAAGNCCALPFKDSAFDSAGSSLALQWASDIRLAFSEAARVLKPGGLFVCSTLGPKTLCELRECYEGRGEMKFEETGSIKAALSSSGLEAVFIEERLVKRQYASFIDLLRTLKMIGAAPQVDKGRGLSPGRRMRQAGTEYAGRFPSPDGGILASYELVIIGARKR